MNKVFVYGSLKKGFYNYERCGLDKAKFIGKGILKGYKMYSLGSYPCIVADEKSQVYGEIYEYTDKQTEERIKNMELSAGYIEVEVQVGTVKALTYVMEKAPKYYNPKPITKGEWCWKPGLMYNALHNVGDDPVKSAIEQDLGREFYDEPDVLHRIAKVFSENTEEE